MPKWKVNEIKSDEDDNEEEIDAEEADLSDAVFLARHEKSEELERAMIKKDQSYQKEQFYHSRLKVIFSRFAGFLDFRKKKFFRKS